MKKRGLWNVLPPKWKLRGGGPSMATDQDTRAVSFVDWDCFLNPGHRTSSQDIPPAWSESLHLGHRTRHGLWHCVRLKSERADQESQMVLSSAENKWVTKQMNARGNYSFACEILVGHRSLLRRKDPRLAWGRVCHERGTSGLWQESRNLLISVPPQAVFPSKTLKSGKLKTRPHLSRVTSASCVGWRESKNVNP